EAQRLGTLINSKSPNGEEELEALLIENLARLHSNTPQEYEEIRRIIEEYTIRTLPTIAASAYHAWLVGALESAVRRVYQFLYKHSEHDAKVNEVFQAYNDNKITAPYGPIPPEFDRTRDVLPLDVREDKNLEGVSAGGEWLRQGVLAEGNRMQQGGDRLDTAKVDAEQVKEFVMG
ncbi:MAG: hypothetical protein Q9218_008296, partial [Villophora microphyllina]